MDNIFELVVFFVTAIIFIVSAITKQKKKSNAKPSNVENLVESLFGLPDETQQQNIAEEEPIEYQETKTTYQPKTDFKRTESTIGIKDAIPKDDIATMENEEEDEEIDFDVRQAVIYSEILNRKHF